MKPQFDVVEISPKSTHRYSIVWLHGLGADGHDFESIVPALGLTEEYGIHFVFPNAPVQPVTINGGMAMRSWYDILDMTLERKVDIDGIYQSLHTGLRFQHKLAGILALSCYLPMPERLKTERTAINSLTPILIAHGTWDPVIPLRSGKTAYQCLKALQYPVEWREYPMEHGLCPEEIQHIANFIKECFDK